MGIRDKKRLVLTSLCEPEIEGKLFHIIGMQQVDPSLGDGVANLPVEIGGVKRLDQEPVGASFETGRHLLELGIHADHQDWEVFALDIFPDLAQDIQTIHLRHVGVEQHKGRPVFLDLAQAFSRALGLEDLVSSHPLENDPDRLYYSRIVIDYKNVHLPLLIGVG
jgi:hypothetical protein